MPADYQIDRARGIVFSRAWGVTLAADYFAHGHRLQADPDFQPGYRQLWDLTEMTRGDMAFADLIQMAQVNIFAPTARRAVVAPADVAFGLARMFQTLRAAKGETGIRVFRDRIEALRWLETGDEPAPELRTDSANPLRSSPRRA